MPSGGRRVQIGDSCRGCNCEITERMAIYKGIEKYMLPWCKYCYKKHRDSVPSRSKKSRAKQYIEWKWNISYERYNIMLSSQLGGCAICKQPCKVQDRLAVDHNHITGQIRDLLCHRCNTVLGMLEEDEDLLIDMIEYIKRHNQKLVA